MIKRRRLELQAVRAARGSSDRRRLFDLTRRKTMIDGSDIPHCSRCGSRRVIRYQIPVAFGRNLRGPTTVQIQTFFKCAGCGAHRDEPEIGPRKAGAGR